jgi:acyl carrier protein
MKAGATKTEDELRELLSAHSGIEPAEITLRSSIVDDLNMDSLDLMEVIIEYEGVHAVGIDDGGEEITTVAELLAALQAAK